MKITRRSRETLSVLLVVVSICGSCGSTAPPPPPVSPAIQSGVGAECTTAADCPNPPDAGRLLQCLAFKGGYCGLEGCTGDADCPLGSGCVAHTDGKAYCF